MIEVDATVTDVRKLLDQVEHAGDLTVYDVDFDEDISTEFEDQDLRNRVLDGARFISARVGAQHQPGNVREIDSATAGEIDLANDRIIDDPVGDEVQPFIRLLQTRVEAGSYQVERRTLRGNMKLEATGRSATEEEPAYVYEDYEFIVEQGSGSNTVMADVVSLLEPTNATFDGTTWTFNDGGTSQVPLSSHLREALVQYVAYTCFVTMDQSELAEYARSKMMREIAPHALPGAISFDDE